jgi:hypothetical protein
MLSIGKLAVGQADYYLEQARGRTTRARAVASGVEDYYRDTVAAGYQPERPNACVCRRSSVPPPGIEPGPSD